MSWYSPLNNYHYNNKSSVMSCLDFFSTPARRVLGGRNVNVLTQAAENKMSTTRKVMVVFISVLIPAIALISMTALLLKLATMPWVWEKKRIQVQSDKAKGVIDQFDAVFKKNSQEAIKLVTSHPHLAKRNDIYDKFWKSLEQSVNNHATWADLGPSLAILRPADAITMIKHAIGTQISYEFNSNSPVTTPQHVIDFIKKSLHRSADVLSCYEGLISGTLQIDSKEDLLFNAIRLDCADQIIKDYVRMRKSLTPTEFGTIACDELLLKNKLFKGGDGSYYRIVLLSHPAVMQNIHTTLEDIRTIRRLKEHCPAKVKALIANHNGNLKEQCAAIQAEFAHFEKSNNELLPHLNETEVGYLHSLQTSYNDRFACLHALIAAHEGSADISKVQVWAKAQASEDEAQKKLLALSNDHEVTGKCKPEEEISRALRLKRKNELLMCVSIMNPLLNTYLEQVIKNLSKHAKV